MVVAVLAEGVDGSCFGASAWLYVNGVTFAVKVNVYGVAELEELEADCGIGVTVQPGTPGTGTGTPTGTGWPPRPATNGFGPEGGRVAIAAVAGGGRSSSAAAEGVEMKRERSRTAIAE